MRNAIYLGMTNDIENVIIIGGGPAGLAAAVYTSRANLTPLLIAGSPPGGQLILTSDVENYPGFESILGPELIEKMRLHAKKFGTRIIDKNVVRVDFSKRPFEIYTPDTNQEVKHLAKSIIIATGAQAKWLGLDSETRLRGKGVSACATCDGFFFKEKVVGVVGGGDTAMEESLFLTKFASKVIIFHRRDEFRASKIMQDRVLANKKIEVVWNTVVTEVLGQNKVEGLKIQDTKTKDSKEIKADGLFLAIGHVPDTKIFQNHIELDEKGYAITSVVAALNAMKDSKSEGNNSKFNPAYQYMTSVQGVFASGDCVDHVYRQAGTAAGMGIAAALEAEKWLEVQSL